ncbi:MAG: LamG domain-containing protein [Candidatus Binatia bacterium]
MLSISFDQSTVPEKGDGPVVEHDIAFDGQGATFSTDSQFAIPDAANLTGDAGTISFCVTPQWGGDEPIDASLVNLRTPNQFNNRLQIAKNGQYLRFLTADNTGHEAGAGVNISSWQPGQGHLVTATWGEALTSLYVDGKLVGSQTYEGQIEITPGTPMYIGSDIPGGSAGAQGSLAKFQVYNRALPLEEVSNLSGNCQ